MAYASFGYLFYLLDEVFFVTRFIKKSPKKIGEHPGALIYVGEKYLEKANAEVLEFNKVEFNRQKLNKIEECFEPKLNNSVRWINVNGLHNVEVIEKIGQHFGLHPLILEDILNTGHRVKMDDYDDYIFLVLKMLHFNDKTSEIKSEQVSFILLPDCVFTFQEYNGDAFDNVRERISSGKGNIRKQGADYILYALVDAIVDSYYIILENLGDMTEDVEEKLMDNPDKSVLQSIYTLKRELLFLRNSIWPLRSLVDTLITCDSPLFNSSTNIYFRDIYDHVIQVIDTIETYRDMLSGMLDTYLSSIGNKTNDTMKVLTILSTIFIPITFIAGIYGMNFKYMPPELQWKYGYPLFWAVNAVITILFVIFFKKKKWI